jgi:ATPase subunit of ABC transporter with duplicated ATPase domains
LTHEHIESQIITLSGGEAAKVRLCKLTIGEYNCLVLDEPTNHLDVLAKEALQEAIQNYKGTILLVCHEADFYQTITSRVINLEEYAL